MHRWFAITAAVLICLWTPTLGRTQSANQVDYYYAKQDWNSLVKLGSPAIPKLKAALNDAKNSVRYFAMFAIQFADQKYLGALRPLSDTLVSIMNTDVSANNRNGAAEALKKLSYTPETKEQQLRYFLAFDDFRVDGDPRAYRSFEEATSGSYHNFPEEAAVPKLAALRDGNGELLVAILKDLLSRGHQPEAIFAIVTLGGWGDKAATEGLIKLANCSDRVGLGFTNVAPRCPVTAVAVVALSKLDDPPSKARIVDHIASLLGSKNVTPDVILASAITLERLHDKRSIPALAKVLADKTIGHWEYEYKWTERLCESLASFGPDSLDALSKGLENPNVPKAYVFGAIGTIRDDRAAAILIAQLGTGMKEVPEALGHIGLKSSVPALIEAIAQDKASGDFKIATLRALARIGNKSAIDSVRLKMSDPNSDVRQEAARTLDALGWKPK